MMSDGTKTSGRRWRIWPEWAWRWKTFDVCRRSWLNRRARFCADCGSELHISDLPIRRQDWADAWFTLAVYLWLAEAALLGVGEIEEIGGVSLFGMLIPAGAILAAFALVVVWRLTPKSANGKGES